MDSRWFVKIAAIVCAACLAMGVMSQTVFARDDASAQPEYLAELPEATFVVLGADAQPASPSPEVTDNRQTLPLYVGEKRMGDCAVIGGEPYVGVAAFMQAMGLEGEVIDYGTALSLSMGGVRLSAQAGRSWLVCNDRYLYLTNTAKDLGGALALPVETLVKCLGVTAYWDRVLWRVTVADTDLSPLEEGSRYYDESNVYWLSRMISAMADGQPFEAELSVGSVCVNRMNSADFPGQSTIYDVVFAKNQFSIVTNGMIYNEPDDTAVLAAKLALEGCDLTGGAMYLSRSDLGAGYRQTARFGDLRFYTEA